MQRRCLLALLAATGMAVNTAAWSQSVSPPTTPRPNMNCAPHPGAEAPTDGSGRSNSNLSDRLAQSGGVICPPAVKDSEMAVPPPDNSGRMPVIPPPGTPGGDPSVRPK